MYIYNSPITITRNLTADSSNSISQYKAVCTTVKQIRNIYFFNMRFLYLAFSCILDYLKMDFPKLDLGHDYRIFWNKV